MHHARCWNGYDLDVYVVACARVCEFHMYLYTGKVMTIFKKRFFLFNFIRILCDHNQLFEINIYVNKVNKHRNLFFFSKNYWASGAHNIFWAIYFEFIYIYFRVRHVYNVFIMIISLQTARSIRNSRDLYTFTKDLALLLE